MNKADDLVKRSDLLERIREFTSISSGYFENPELLERVIREMPAAPPVCVGIVTFDEEELRRIVDEKAKGIEIDVQEIRNRAIEEFKEELYRESADFKNIESVGYEMLSYEDVCEVAERLKRKRGNGPVIYNDANGLYYTRDGEAFDTREEALQHQQKLN